jgi:hypothetical protein
MYQYSVVSVVFASFREVYLFEVNEYSKVECLIQNYIRCIWTNMHRPTPGFQPPADPNINKGDLPLYSIWWTISCVLSHMPECCELNFVTSISKPTSLSLVIYRLCKKWILGRSAVSMLSWKQMFRRSLPPSSGSRWWMTICRCQIDISFCWCTMQERGRVKSCGHPSDFNLYHVA